ncbi:MAG: hypothetical protein HY578_08415 [Nitrospinae bacterium]|nr:hypothetical protein [Nitrospinota bacterium]
MVGYLIYHPKRYKTEIDGKVIYHDSIKGNQDPYLWNKKFLHTYCHITQMSPEIGQINFWASGDTFPNFNSLYCDLVFFVAEKHYWQDVNKINPSDSPVDSEEAYNDHYTWVNEGQHHYKRRRRFTLKADPQKSFQPQGLKCELFNIVPVLESIGLSLLSLREGLCARRGSKPLELKEDQVTTLYQWFLDNAPIKLFGKELESIRREHSELASQPTKGKLCS